MLPRLIFNKVLVFVLSYFFIGTNLFAQNLAADSLLQLVNHSNHDSINGNIYYELAKTHYSSDTKNALKWAREGAQYFNNISSFHKMTRCMNLEAVCLFILDRPDESIKLHYKILKLREDLNDTDAVSETLINIGNIFYKGQDKEKALQFYLHSKELALKKNNIKLLSSIYNNIANVYKDKYYLTKKENDKILAIKYSKIALTYKEKLKTDKTIENAYLTLARLFFDSKDFKSAKNYANKAEVLAIQNRNDESVATSKLILSELSIENKMYQEAQKKIDELYVYTTKNKAFHILNTFDEEIFAVRNKIRNLESNSTAISDSLNTTDLNTLLLARQKIREELSIKYDTEKKELDNLNLMLKNEIEHDNAKKNKIISIISIFFTVVLIVLISILIKKNKSISKSESSIQEQAKKLHEQNTLLKQSEAFKAKLFSIISHDLKSPLSTLKSIVSLSSDTQLNPEQLSFVMKEIKDELNITSNLLNELLFWSKAQMKTNSISWSSFYLLPIIERCTLTLHSNIKIKQLNINHQIPDKLEIWGDEVRCEFIIRNILHNAIKFSDFHQTIEIGIKEEEDFWDFYIKDNGIGIADEKIKKLLNQEESIKSTKGTLDEQGAGIGLLLCHDFAKSLNWSLQVESVINNGTIFHVMIRKKYNQTQEKLRRKNKIEQIQYSIL